jgi:hypothetical protein
MKQVNEQEIAFIIKMRETTDISWYEITDKFNKKFGTDRDFESVKKIYQRNKDLFNEDDYEINLLTKVHRSKKANSGTAKENRTIIQHWADREDILEVIDSVVKSNNKVKYTPPKHLPTPASAHKEKMTLEQLFSDVHFGKLIKDDRGNVVVDGSEIKRRVQKLADQIIKEIYRNKDFFDIERFIIAMLGDMIESSHMHGEESLKGSEFGTSRQMFECIQTVFNDLIIPISMTGIPAIDIYCVPGNHDRLDRDQTYVQPGENNLTYVIYKTLEMMCQAAGLKNVHFHITTGGYITAEIYGNTALYEHGNELKGLNRQNLLELCNKRQNQIKQIINFYRVGHWHEHVTYGQGRLQVNGSVPGQDDYAKGKGFDSEALQILNYYVKTDKRSTCFFRSFPIYLEEIK